MIEDSVIMLICLMCFVPMVIGAIWAFLTRPAKYYYKFTGGRMRRIRIRSGSGKEK